MKSVKTLALVAWFLLCSTRLFAWTYTNQEFNFSATLPDGYTDVSGQARAKCLVAQQKIETTTSGHIETVILLDLKGAIGREDLSKEGKIPANASLEKTEWKSFKIDVIRVIENIGGVSFVTLNAQVPLKPHAIQVSVAGPASDETKLRADLLAIVASVDGPTNWLTDEQRFSPKPNWIAVVVGLLVIITGRLRISKNYGLIGTGARIGGFFILVLGIALPFLLTVGLSYLISVGVQVPRINFLIGLVAWITFHWLLIWAAVVMLVKEYGNSYGDDADEVRSSDTHPIEPPKVIKRLIAQCHMCKTPIPPEQQETVRACPSCGADLTRVR
jgi:hypothetical protein